MTIPAADYREEFLGNGTTKTFSFDWRVFSKNEVEVTLVDSDGAESVLVVDDDYTVNNINNTSGGSVTLNVAPANGEKLILLPNYKFEQQTDLRNQGRFYPEIHEDEFDRQTVLSKQLHEVSGRSVKLPKHIPPTEFNVELPNSITQQGGYFLATAEGGDGWELYPKNFSFSEYLDLSQTAAASAQLYRDESLQYRNEALGYKNESLQYSLNAQGYRDSAQIAAASAGQDAVLSEQYSESAYNSAIQLQEFIDNQGVELVFPLDLGLITDAPPVSSYDLGGLS